MIMTKDKYFYKNLIGLSVPIVLQNLVTFCVGLADNLMIGSFGDEAVSGVYMANQVQTLLQVFSAGIEGAILVLAAQYWGKKDTDTIKKTVSIGLKVSLIFGFTVSLMCIIFPFKVISLFSDEKNIISCGGEYLSILAYSFTFFCLTQCLIAAMRSIEKAKIGLIVSVASLVINISLNYILIFGKLGFKPMQIKGAAVATLISRITEALIMVSYTLFSDKILKFRFKHFISNDKNITKDFFRYGLPIIAGQLVWAVNMTANSVILGHINEQVVTGASVANILNNLAYVTINGVSGAIGIIAGKTAGAGKNEKLKEYSKSIQIILIILGLFTGLSVFILKKPFISLYNISDEAIVYSTQFINVLSVTIIGSCYECPCLVGLVKSGGDISFVFKNDAIFVFLVVIPSALLSVKFGLPAFITFALLKCDQILKCIVAAIKVNKFNWIKNLTQKT